MMYFTTNRFGLRRNVVRRTFAAAFSAAVAIGYLSVPAVAQVATLTVDGGETVFSPVASYEWNTDGDFEGWTPNANINNAAVTGGAMAGESLGDGSFPAGADPFFNGPGGFTIGNGAGEASRVQFAAQFNNGAPTVRTEVFFFPDDGTPFASVSWNPGGFPVITDGAIHVYNIDFDPSSSLWGASIGAIRLDPVADNQSAVDTFAYDYLRVGRTSGTVFLAGDVDEDNDVDADDFELIRANFFQQNVGRSNGDLNQDGVVNLVDFGQWKDNFPFPAAPFLRQLVGVVPEPASGMIALVGLAALGLRRTRS